MRRTEAGCLPRSAALAPGLRPESLAQAFRWEIDLGRGPAAP